MVLMPSFRRTMSRAEAVFDSYEPVSVGKKVDVGLCQPFKECEWCGEEYCVCEEHAENCLGGEADQTQGIHKDEGKVRLDLVPVSAVRGMALAFENGLKKYPPNNWKKGILYSRLLASAERHMIAFKEQEDEDYESGLHPLEHALACIAMILELDLSNKGIDFDDRKETWG